MEQAKADLAPPCVVVLLPDGSARLYDDARLTASTVLADFPRHLLLSTLSTATPRTPLPPAALLKSGRTYYLIADSHRPRTAARLAVDVSSPTSPSSSQFSPSVFHKTQTLHSTSPVFASPHAESHQNPPKTTGRGFGTQRVPGTYGPVSPLSTLSPYSPPLSEGAIPLDCHHGQTRSSPPKAWNEGVGERCILRRTSTCELGGPKSSQSGYDATAGVLPSRRHDGRTANRILQELEALDDMTVNDSAYDTRDHQSPSQLPSPNSAGSITATRRTTSSLSKPSIIDRLPQLKSWSFRSRGAAGRKMNNSQKQKNMSIRAADFPDLGRSIISGGHHMVTPSHCEEEGAFWKNLDDRTMMFTDTQILVSRKEIQAGGSAATPTRAAVTGAGAKVFPRRLPEQVVEPHALDSEHYYSQAFYTRCYNEPILG
ncbi:unnamed protein product [Closterium sp. NIES-53]